MNLKILKTISIFVLLTAISGCSLTNSLFSTVTDLDYKKRPDYAVNKSIHLWKNLKNYESNVTLEYKDKTTKKSISAEITTYYSKNKSSGSFDIVLSDSKIQKIKGKFIKTPSEAYLLIDRNNIYTEYLQKLPTDQWLLFKDYKNIQSPVLETILMDMGAFDKEVLWQILKKANIFKTSNPKEVEINNNNVYYFDISLDQEGLTDLANHIENRFVDIINKFKDYPLYNSFILTESSSGSIWIDKKDFFIRKLNIKNNITPSKNLELEIVIDPNGKALNLEATDYKIIGEKIDNTNEDTLDKVNDMINM